MQLNSTQFNSTECNSTQLNATQLNWMQLKWVKLNFNIFPDLNPICTCTCFFVKLIHIESWVYQTWSIHSDIDFLEWRVLRYLLLALQMKVRNSVLLIRYCRGLLYTWNNVHIVPVAAIDVSKTTIPQQIWQCHIEVAQHLFVTSCIRRFNTISPHGNPTSY